MSTTLQPGTRVVRRHPSTPDADGERHTILERRVDANCLSGITYRIEPAPQGFGRWDWWDASWFVALEREVA